MKIEISEENLGTLCICALRYCQGRETYMPSLVRKICKPFVKKVTDSSLQVMLNDCDFQRKYEMYGDPYIDKPGWLEWKKLLEEEKECRESKVKKRSR